MKEEEFVEETLREEAIHLLSKLKEAEIAKTLLDPSNTFKSRIMRKLNEQIPRRNRNYIRGKSEFRKQKESKE